MDIIKKELEFVKEEIFRNFCDPFNDKALFKFLESGSKFIRSTLAILYLKSQNIELKNEHYKILASIEIIHNASLLHDDIIDNAITRRGLETLGQKFNSSISILAGDYLISYALEKLINLNNITVFDKFKTCTKEMSEAEIKQYFLRNKKPQLEEYINICRGKTASLFSLVLELTNQISLTNDIQARNFGEAFGIFFQIKNDLEKTSKENDKINGISTATDILGIEKTNALLDNYKEEMRKIIKNFPQNIYKEALEDLINSL